MATCYSTSRKLIWWPMWSLEFLFHYSLGNDIRKFLVHVRAPSNSFDPSRRSIPNCLVNKLLMRRIRFLQKQSFLDKSNWTYITWWFTGDSCSESSLLSDCLCDIPSWELIKMLRNHWRGKSHVLLFYRQHMLWSKVGRQHEIWKKRPKFGQVYVIFSHANKILTFGNCAHAHLHSCSNLCSSNPGLCESSLWVCLEGREGLVSSLVTAFSLSLWSRWSVRWSKVPSGLRMNGCNFQCSC